MDSEQSRPPESIDDRAKRIRNDLEEVNKEIADLEKVEDKKSVEAALKAARVRRMYIQGEQEELDRT